MIFGRTDHDYSEVDDILNTPNSGSTKDRIVFLSVEGLDYLSARRLKGDNWLDDNVRL
jgi:hypothetical protein